MVKRALFVLIALAWPGMAEDPDQDKPEFVFARLIYPGGFRGGTWATDYPEADYKFMYGIKRLSGVRVNETENPIRIDDRIFEYPYVYAVEVGYMNLGTADAERLREYLLRGGFMHADDFWGLDEFQNFQRQMRKVFPDRSMEELPLTHEVFHTCNENTVQGVEEFYHVHVFYGFNPTGLPIRSKNRRGTHVIGAPIFILHFELRLMRVFYDVDQVMQIPNVNNGCRGGRTWENPFDTRPRVFGIKDDTGRVMVLITYNSDLGDAWEWMDEPCYPVMYSGQAYRMGLNFIIYAMSH